MMSGEVVNLRLARKSAARIKARGRAAESRARFGGSKAEKALANSEKTKSDRTLDGARRDP